MRVDAEVYPGLRAATANRFPSHSAAKRSQQKGTHGSNVYSMGEIGLGAHARSVKVDSKRLLDALKTGTSRPLPVSSLPAARSC